MAQVKETVVKTVQLDAQVVLKVMQHCNSALPHLVTGQLLGLDVGQTLEVTDCFPFPVRAPPPFDQRRRNKACPGSSSCADRSTTRSRSTCPPYYALRAFYSC